MLLHKYVHLYGFSVRFFSTKYIMDALLAAVSRGDSPAALQLIKKRAYNPQAVYADGRNALQLACYSNMTDVANKLIDSGKFALNTVDPDGSLLLMIACMNRMESTAAKLVSTDNGHLDATGNTALMVACGANLPTIAIALLKRSRPIGLNVINKNGVNALLIAAGKKLADVCLLLIDLGADVSQVSTGGGNTALILAAKGGLGMDAVVAKLLDKGANAASVNALGESALFWAASTNAHNIKRLITPQTINQAQTSTGNTPLIVACLSLNTDAAMAVLESPIVDPALANKRGQTAETIAVSQGLRPVVERLIRGTTVAINADKTVSDFVNQEDVNIRSYLAASNDHIIFTIDATNHMFASSRSAILRDFDTKVRYRCHVADTLRPENVDLSLPLYSMRQIGVMVDFCLADDMRAIAADVGHQVYTLKKVTGRPVVSVVSHDVFKNKGSVVGAAHCQSGQGGFYYLVVKADTYEEPTQTQQTQTQQTQPTHKPVVLNSIQLQLKGQRTTFSTRVDTTVGDLKTMAERRLGIQTPTLVYGGKKLVNDEVLIRHLPNYMDGMVITVMGQPNSPSMSKSGGKRRY